MNWAGSKSKRTSKYRWIDCVKDDMQIKGEYNEMTVDRHDWKR